MTRVKRPQQLQRRHFAFMRALLQGLDPRASWDRYLRTADEAGDQRSVKRAIDWIRDAFATAARRASRPGTARLVLMDPDRLPAAKALPTLEAFAAERGLEDFSEEEQAEAYLEAFPEAAGSGRGRSDSKTRRSSPRARLVHRQLEALHWLESVSAQEPHAYDDVTAWLNPAVAHRLKVAGLPTLRAVVESINLEGARWWRHVSGVGPLKAERVVAWLRSQEDIADLLIGPHARSPRRKVAAGVLDMVVPAGTALVPFEKLVLPASLDGSTGRYRASQSQCRISASNDHAALSAWIASKAKPLKGRPAMAGAPLSATQRAYRKEAERLLLWCVLERKLALSSLSAEDADAYWRFLSAPPAPWCGARHHQRWSRAWRPLEGPLSPAALRHVSSVLKALFAFLVGQQYLICDPFKSVALPARPRLSFVASRTLTFAQWDRIDAVLEEETATQTARRRARAVRWLYATGLRLSEITAVRLAHLEERDHEAEGAHVQSWWLRVPGEGLRSRSIAVPGRLIDELRNELIRCGRCGNVLDPANADVALLSRFEAAAGAPGRPLSSSGLSKGLKALMLRVQSRMEGEDSELFGRASAHWLRHTHALHALEGRAGACLPLRQVQASLGHASIRTTRAYLVENQGNERMAT